MAIGEELGGLLAENADALGIEPAEAESYGKAAMVGENASWSMLRLFSIQNLASHCAQKSKKGRLSLSKKMGSMGQPLDVPLVIRMQPMSVPTLMVWKFDSMTHPVQTRLWSQSL